MDSVNVFCFLEYEKFHVKSYLPCVLLFICITAVTLLGHHHKKGKEAREEIY